MEQIIIAFEESNRWLDAFAKMHPATAHFPVALLIAAFIAEFLSWWRNKNYLRRTGHFCLIFGALGALLTSINGFPLATMQYMSTTTPLLDQHKYTGLATAIFALLTGCFVLFAGPGLSRKYRWVYRILLIVIAILVIITGHTGGKLVYGESFINYLYSH